MATRTIAASPQARARVAGLLYLSLIPFDVFGLEYVSSRLIVPGDATATANHILASESLFRLGIASDLIGGVLNILVVLALYQVLKPASKNMAALMVIFWLVAAPIGMLNEANHLAILYVVHRPAGMTADQVHTLVGLLLNLHADGITVAEIFWGLWLLPMGFLVFTSGFLPRILGVLLLIGGVGYLLQSFFNVLVPDFNVPIYLYTDWGEVLFPLWLVIRGVNVAQWEKRAREAA